MKNVIVAISLIAAGLIGFATYENGLLSHERAAFSFADSRLVSELTDGTHAATTLPTEAFEKRVVLPPSKIDLTIDRHELLKAIFKSVSSKETTEQGKVEAWVRYLQDRIVHPKEAPLLENGQAIYDPLWILKNQIAQCGQTNRVLVDGLEAAGYQARLVQLKAHVAAEVFLDGAWRFLDADWLGLGQFVRKSDGTLPSAYEIYKNRGLLKGIHPGLEFKLYPVNVLPLDSPSYEEMFTTRPYYYVKTATVEQLKNEYYGWNYYETLRE